MSAESVARVARDELHDIIRRLISEIDMVHLYCRSNLHLYCCTKSTRGTIYQQISTQDRTHANKPRNEHTSADTRRHTHEGAHQHRPGYDLRFRLTTRVASRETVSRRGLEVRNKKHMNNRTGHLSSRIRCRGYVRMDTYIRPLQREDTPHLHHTRAGPPRTQDR